MTSDQNEVISFLENPASYPFPVERVEKIETHGAIIFIADKQVYKIKKAVNFSYMDFSTLEQRQKVCNHEIEINRKHAPGIYIDTIPITREHDGSLQIKGNGTPVEWAVHMNSFKQSEILANLADNNLITSDLINQLARVIADYHSCAPTSHHIDIVANLADLISDLEKIFTEHSAIFGNDGKTFSQIAKQQLEQSSTSLKYRAEHGYIRRCHGDLHLQNIVLINNKPVLFDAIEFDEDIATIDIFYDLAFLLMDLKQRGLKQAANQLFNRYLFHKWTTPNLEGLKAMPLFLACRAAIRAMVHAQQSHQKNEPEKRTLISSAKQYMSSALNYLETTPPQLIAIGGLSGTGKSTLAAALAPSIGNTPGAVHLRSDLERKNMFEVEETEHLPPQLYTAEVNEKVYNILLNKAELALKAGHSVIVDAVFRQKENRDAIQALAKKLNIPFSGIWLQAPEETMFSRVDNRKGDASDAKSDTVKKQLASETGDITWNKINASGSLTDTMIEVSALF